MLSTRTLGRWRKRRLRRKLSIELCSQHATTPAVGGIEVDDAVMMRYPYLPEYVVLHEPSQQDIWASPGKMRSIFLNQPLEAWENAAINKFCCLLKKDMKLDGDEELPRWILPHLSRLLQQCKYKPEPALKLWSLLLEERVDKLPISYRDVREGLRFGFVYFHGRDMRCRPLLTIRVGRSAPFFGKPDLIKLVFLYSMEFAVRYLMVPGRVENWSVIIDCSGIENLPSFWRVKDVAHAIAATLGKVYSGRMAWTKIFNFPKSWPYKALRVFVEGIVSGLGKSEKVAIVSGSDTAAWKGQVELGQLEEAFGGTAPDLAPEDTFPPRMFSSPKGYDATTLPETSSQNDPNVSSDAPSSLHMMTDLRFHEGLLCADCLEQTTAWKERVQQLPLPKEAADVFGGSRAANIKEWCNLLEEAFGMTGMDSAGEDSCGLGIEFATATELAIAGEGPPEEDVVDSSIALLSDASSKGGLARVSKGTADRSAGYATSPPRVLREVNNALETISELDARQNADVDATQPITGRCHSRGARADASPWPCTCNLSCFI